MTIKCTFCKVRNSQVAKIHCTRPFNKRNSINTAVQNSTSSELVTLRGEGDQWRVLFLLVVSNIQLLRAIQMPLRLAPLCSCLLQNQPGTYAGQPLIKPLEPGALNLKTLAHNGRYCQLLFLLLILGDKKGVRISKRKTAKGKGAHLESLHYI